MKGETKEEFQKEIEILRRKIAELGSREHGSLKGVSLQVSEQDYKNLTESLSELVYRADPETFEATYVNSAIERFYGYTEEEWLSHPRLWERSIHPEDRKRVLAEFRKAKERLKNAVVRYRIIKKDKSLCWVEDHVSWEKDQGGRAVSMDGVMYDITELKEIEIALGKAYEMLETKLNRQNTKLISVNEKLSKEIAARKQTEEILQKIKLERGVILDSLQELVTYQDRKLRVLRANRAAGKSVGLSPKQLIGRHCYEIWHQRRKPCSGCPVVRSLKTGRQEKGEVVSPDGRLWFIRAYPIRDMHGKVIGVVETTTDITERKKSERIMRESKERFQQVSENAQEWIWEIDASGLYTYVSPAVKKILGYKPKEIVGKKYFYDLFCPEDRGKLKRAAFGVFVKKEPFREFLNCNVHKNGKTVWLSTSGVPILDERGNLLGYRGADMDITERRKAEEQLRKSENKYRTLLKNIPQRIFYKDLNSIYVLCNDSYANDLNINPNEIVGKTDYDFYPKELAEKYRADDKKIMQSGKAREIEERYIAHGQELIVHTFKAPLKDNEGNIVGIFGIFWDITDRKKAEGVIQVSERKFKDLVETTTDWVWETDANTRYVYSSPKVKELLGYEVSDVLGKTPFDFMSEQEKKRVSKFLKEKMRDRQPFHGLENINLHKDGHLVVLETNAIPIFDDDGQFKGYRGIDRNITQRRKAEKKLEIINQELLKANKRLRKLILRDAQTGLYNYRYLAEVIEPEFQRAKRYEHALSVIMIDIDYFKSINDVYGHKFGDMVLKQFARVLKKTVRRYDIIIRFGGEEFLIISPGTDRATALMLAGRIQEAISLYNFGELERVVEVKLSTAVASFPDDKAIEGIDLIEIADKIINKAKEDGGNRIYSSSDISKERRPAETVKAEDLAEVKFLREKIDKLNKKANQSLIEAIFAFVKTIKLKDSYTGEHVERMVHYSTEIAHALNLTREEIEGIKQASVLHDLGKIGIGERILLKSKKLSRKEFELIKKHPQIGVDIIRPIHYLHNIIPIILYHHEKWNGDGYPKGLKGEEIPIGARIVAVADVYQALISDRPYRRAYLKEQAIEIIKSGAGIHFDPKVVNIFLEIIKK